LDNYYFLLEKREEFSNAPLIPPRILTGKDLIDLGHKPGPEFKKILDTAQALQLEGVLNTREDALAWLAANPST
jgi:poly(A) polymerase